MKITFLGATHEVTGSCSYLEVNGHCLLVDCGMEQGKNYFVNEQIPVKASEIEAVLLTHAHIDHSGRLPWLYKNGFRGSVFATEPTCELCRIMLKDSAHIQESEAQWRNRKAMRSGGAMYEPLYTMEDAEGLLKLLVPVSYNRTVRVVDGVEISFTDIGHLLGSGSIKVTMTEGAITKTMVFSGDIGNINHALLNDPMPTDSADYVMVESTYGNRLHKTARPGDNFVTELTRCIQTAMDRGGNLVIPSFAVGRTQEILYYIRQIKKEGMVHGHDNFRVVVDSPLATEATQIFMNCKPSYFDGDMRALLDRGENPLSFPGLEMSVSTQESVALNSDMSPKVIISASGMCEAGRIRHHLKHNLWRPECIILFVGYQSYGTLGRAIYDGAKKVRLFGEEIEVNAEIAWLTNASGHADMKGLMAWVDGFSKQTPSMFFVNHGEDESCTAFTNTLREKGLNAYAPYSGTVFDLAEGGFVKITEGIPVAEGMRREELYAISNTAAAADVGGDALYRQLQAASNRLVRLAQNAKGRPNKDLKKIIHAINELCREWEK